MREARKRPAKVFKGFFQVSGLALDFGGLESMLAGLNDISDSKRTAFQSRLKNFHRLNYPPDLRMAKGKATTYRPRDVLRMALATQLAQLGIGPERSIALLTFARERGVAQGVLQATIGIIERDELSYLQGDPNHIASIPDNHYLGFDPLGLQNLTDEAFKSEFNDFVAPMTSKEVMRSLEVLTVSFKPRLALVNLTSILNLIAPSNALDDEKYKMFLLDCMQWARDVIEETKDYSIARS